MESTLLLLSLLSSSVLSTFAQESTTGLENTSWQLIAIHSVNDSVFEPHNPENYLLRFRLDNRLQIEADCNQAGATYEQDGDSLSITELVSTRKLCVSPSLFNRFIMILTQSESIRREGDNLILNSRFPTDWMEFEPYVFVPEF